MISFRVTLIDDAHDGEIGTQERGSPYFNRYQSDDQWIFITSIPSQAKFVMKEFLSRASQSENEMCCIVSIGLSKTVQKSLKDIRLCSDMKSDCFDLRFVGSNEEANDVQRKLRNKYREAALIPFNLEFPLFLSAIEDNLPDQEKKWKKFEDTVFVVSKVEYVKTSLVKLFPRANLVRVEHSSPNWEENSIIKRNGVDGDIVWLSDW